MHFTPFSHRTFAWLVVGVLLIARPSALQAETDFSGAVAAQWTTTGDSHSWLEGGYGVLRQGESSSENTQDVRGSAQFSLRWQPNDLFLAHLHVLGSSSNGTAEGRAGIVEAYAEVHLLEDRGGVTNNAHHISLRLGTFFLPTTFENVDPLWRSPYTITPSALTSWIGEELRPTGLQIDYRLDVTQDWTINVGGSIFGGSDSSGALLAWRGWSLTDRVSTWGETIPLPPLPSFDEGGVFEPQRNDGTQPFGTDLDGEPGWAAWLGTRWHNGGALQLTSVDTRGDRGLHDGEYAWETEFYTVGGDLPLGQTGVLVAEWMWGSTGMQPGPLPRVQIDFSTWYLLANWQQGRWLWTLRRDEFENKDRASYPGTELTDQVGDAWTASVGLEIGRVTGRLEWLEVTSRRPAVGLLTPSDQTGGRSIGIELELSW